jgi:hypothetical protein
MIVVILYSNTYIPLKYDINNKLSGCITLYTNDISNFACRQECFQNMEIIIYSLDVSYDDT